MRPNLPLIAIQPLGTVDPQLVRATESQLARMFTARIIVLPPRPLPRSAYYPSRQRYRAEKVLANLESRTPRGVDKVVGIMSRDLSATKGSVYDWGVLGLAELDRRAAVVSVNRLKRGGASPTVVARRTRRVAMHELGHTFGLRHCKSTHCIMSDASGTVRTVDRSSGEFCPLCRLKLGGVLREQAPAPPKL
jgi:archaemetzincin